MNPVAINYSENCVVSRETDEIENVYLIKEGKTTKY
jgi:hypothetical protein